MDWSKFGRLFGRVTLIGAKRYLADRYKMCDKYHYVLNCLRKLGQINLRDELIKAEGEYYTYYKSIEFSVDQVDIRYSDRYTACFSVALKLIEKDFPNIAGAYTLFNKLNRSTDKDDFFRNNHWPRLKKWLFTKKERTKEFYTKFRRSVAKLLIPVKKPSNVVDFETFVNERALWATAGSTDMKSSIPKGFPKTKAAYAYTNTTNQIFESLDTNKSTWSIIEKSEPGAVRNVVLVDTPMYLAQSYVLHYYDKLLGEQPWLYNYKDNAQKLKFWLDNMRMNKLQMINIDLDYSGWDEGVDLELIEIIYDELDKHSNHIFKAQLLKIVELTKNTWLDISNLVDNLQKLLDLFEGLERDGSKLKVLNGLGSGRRDTTFINSITNAAIVQMFLDDKELNEYVLLKGVLGDDNHIVATMNLMEYGLVDYLADIGFEINKYKSKVGVGHGEFLKMIVTDSYVRGDARRAIRSILWSSEEIEKNNTGPISVLNARLDIWTKYISRLGGRNEDYVSLVLEDLQGAVRNKSREDIRLFINTPKFLGGSGFLCKYFDKRFETTKSGDDVNKRRKVNGGANKVKIEPAFTISRKIINDGFRKMFSDEFSDNWFKVQKNIDSVNTLNKANNLKYATGFSKGAQTPALELTPESGHDYVTTWNLIKMSGRALEYLEEKSKEDYNKQDYKIRQLITNYIWYKSHCTKNVLRELINGTQLITTPISMISQFGELIGGLLISNWYQFSLSYMFLRRLTMGVIGSMRAFVEVVLPAILTLEAMR